MRKCYYLMNVGFVMSLFFLFSAQNPKDEKQTITIPTQPELKENAKIKDSLVKVTNKILDNVIEYPTKINNKKDELIKVKEEEQLVFKNYINTVNQSLKDNGRKEKLVIKHDIKQQLREGEIFLVKDSICTTYKRKFLGPKKCTEWEYSGFLVDKNNNKEKLW